MIFVVINMMELLWSESHAEYQMNENNSLPMKGIKL